jgi:hypothetical protein
MALWIAIALIHGYVSSRHVPDPDSRNCPVGRLMGLDFLLDAGNAICGNRLG